MFSYRTLLFGAIVTLSAVAPASASDCPRPIFSAVTTTAAVTQPTTTPPATSTGGTIAASSVVLPNRLIINSVKFTPGRLVSRRTFTGRFHVSDSNGRSVSEALVQVTALPYSWGHTTSGEVRTDQTGWATVKITPLGSHAGELGNSSTS